MSRLSELEIFLQDQVAEGERDSSGQFTLSRFKALEKLAAGILGGVLLASLAPGSFTAFLLVGGGVSQYSIYSESVPTARSVEADFPKFQREWARFDGQTMARI